MHKIFLFICLIISGSIFSQKDTPGSILVRPLFYPGQTINYKVTAEAKSDDPPIVYSRSQQEYRVSFTILDTSNGYTILYQSKTIAASDKNNVTETITANISNN